MQAGRQEEAAGGQQESVLPILGSLKSSPGGALPGFRASAVLEELHKVAPLRACLAAVVAVLQHMQEGGGALSQGRAPLLPPNQSHPSGMSSYHHQWFISEL